MPGRPYFLLREPDEVHPLPASEGQEQQRRLLVITSLPQGGVFLELFFFFFFLKSSSGQPPCLHDKVEYLMSSLTIVSITPESETGSIFVHIKSIIDLVLRVILVGSCIN